MDVDLPEYRFSVGVLHIMAAGSSKNTADEHRQGVLWNRNSARQHHPL